jgi:ribosomal protein S18 acetylase RimI-like enzyme
MIRPARLDDRTEIEAIVDAAYEKYIERIGKPPAPMLDDYTKLINVGAVSVLTDDDDSVAALIVLLPETDHLLLDNIAVRPDRQGRGFGRDLVAYAEREARGRGFSEIRLYTHVTMTENIALYRRLGFVETSRGAQAGYERVFMRKGLV